MKGVSYRGPYVTLGTHRDPVDPQFLLHGFVELRDKDDQVLAVHQAGDLVGIEIAMGYALRYYSYVAVGGVVLDAYDYEDSRAEKAIAASTSRILQWSSLNKLPIADRLVGVISALAGDKKLYMAVTDLARVCGVTRVWSTQILSELVQDGSLVRDGKHFWTKAGV